MSYIAEACIGYVKKILPDPESIPFVAKLQKAKTRKGKDYFILRATIPKDVVEKIQAKPGDFLFFKAKKAKWFHMLNWQEMKNTWKMLPSNVKDQVVMDGLINQAGLSKMYDLGATNVTAVACSQLNNVPLSQMGDI
jgi:hypothetical protein